MQINASVSGYVVVTLYTGSESSCS